MLASLQKWLENYHCLIMAFHTIWFTFNQNLVWHYWTLSFTAVVNHIYHYKCDVPESKTNTTPYKYLKIFYKFIRRIAKVMEILMCWFPSILNFISKSFPEKSFLPLRSIFKLVSLILHKSIHASGCFRRSMLS